MFIRLRGRSATQLGRRLNSRRCLSMSNRRCFSNSSCMSAATVLRSNVLLTNNSAVLSCRITWLHTLVTSHYSCEARMCGPSVATSSLLLASFSGFYIDGSFPGERLPRLWSELRLLAAGWLAFLSDRLVGLIGWLGLAWPAFSLAG